MWRSVWLLPFAVAVLAQQPAERPWLPSDSVRAAAADLRTLAPAIRPYARYLSLGCEWEETEIPKAVRVLSGHINQLSRSTVITPPVALADGRVLRIDTRDYGSVFGTQWERLADADPYFHESAKGVTNFVWTGGTWHDGIPYDAGTFRYNRPNVQLARWLSEGKVADATYLVTHTQSRCPIVRADWFFNLTAAAFKRSPNYYDFLGIKDEAGFEKVIGLRKKRLRVELREAVAKSTVTHQPRAIVREEAEGGFRWRTLDFILATGKKDPLENQGRGLDREADATEQYGTLPNYLPVTLAANGKGVRQDFAPAEVASDNRSSSTDTKIHVNVSCMRCHDASGQLQPITAWFRNLTTFPLAGQFANADAEKAYKAALLFREQYGRRLETFLAKDRQVYDDAIRDATGWGAVEYARAYSWMWERYEDAAVGAAHAARDLGVSVARLRAAIDREIRTTGRTSPTLSMFLLEGERAQSVGIRQWEQSYSRAQLTIRGYVEP